MAEVADVIQSDNFPQEESLSIVTMAIKQNNASVDLDLSLMDDSLKAVVVYLLNSPVKNALTTEE